MHDLGSIFFIPPLQHFLREHHHWISSWTVLLEILLLSALFYYGYLYLRRMSATRVLIWIAIGFFTLTFISQLLHLSVISWLLRTFSAYLAISLVIIFQPELRRTLHELGIHRLFSSESRHREALEELKESIFELSAKGFGGLIAIQRNMNLDSIIETGVRLNAELSSELILTLFHPKTVLHDGGVIIQDKTIISAGCIFPLSQRDDLDRTIGLRHRAGIGLSEETDAIVFVISEETGQVSLCYEGKIETHLDEKLFSDYVNQLIIHEDQPSTV